MALKNWVPPTEPRVCSCGCNTVITPQPHHKYYPPTYVAGHQRAFSIRKFIADNTNRHICRCGCNEYIIIRRKHHGKVGIPKYKHGHVVKQQTKKLEQGLREQGIIITKRKHTSAYEFNFWQRVALLRDSNFKCKICGWDKDYTALQFDHIIPISVGGVTSVENGQALCANCHANKTRNETSMYKYNLWRKFSNE